MSRQINEERKPFILQFAEKQVGIPAHQGFYDEELEVTVIKENGKFMPLINSSSVNLQTMTKTAVQPEADDEDPSPPPEPDEKDPYPPKSDN